MKLKNILLSTIVAILLASCAGMRVNTPDTSNNSDSSVTPTPSATPVPSPTPETPQSVRVPSIIYDPILNASSNELIFIEAGEVEANQVLADECFKSGVLNAKFTENRGPTNAQIYQLFLDASPMKVGIKMIPRGLSERINGTVAYEGNPIKMVRGVVVNSTYVASASLHEGFGHNLKFTHYTPKMNPNSIPYTLNRIYEKCAKQLGLKVVY